MIFEMINNIILTFKTSYSHTKFHFLTQKLILLNHLVQILFHGEF